MKIEPASAQTLTTIHGAFDRRTGISWIRQWNSLILLVGAIVAAFCFYPATMLNHDTSWYLIATRMWLNGATLYHDIMEINPPLAFYMTALPIRLADILGIEDKLAFILLLLSVCAATLLWVHALLRRSPETTPAQQSVLFVGFLLAVLVIPVSHFGQREHIMLALTAPYFVLAIVRDGKIGTFERTAIGVVAVLGLALKPYFLLAPICVACVSAFQDRSIRSWFSAQNIAIATGCAAYVAFVWVRHPAYFEVVVPFGRLVYDSLNADLRTVLNKFSILLLLFVLFAWERVRSDPLGWRIMAICVGSLISYLVQFKGWGYHLLPLEGYLTIFGLWLLVSTPQLAARPIRLVLMSLMSVSLVVVAAAKGPYEARFVTALLPLAEGTPERPRMLMLSSRVVVAFPLVNELHATWTSRYPHQWLVPGAVRRLASAECMERPADCQEYQRILDYALETNVEDFLTHSPQLVYVDRQARKTYFHGVPFDYIEFMSRDSGFAERWKSYRKTGEAVGYELWVLDPTL